MSGKSAYDLLQRVAEVYKGPRYNFIRARLSLQTGIDLSEIGPDADDAEVAAELEAAIRDVCPDVKL